VFVPALENDVGDGTGYFKGIQSSEMCAICIMADAKDKSEMYSEVFAELYQFTDKLHRKGMAALEYGPALYPMEVSYPSNLKAIRNTSGRGGNCKKTNFFCHLCSATRRDLVKWREGNQCCERCIRAHRRKCYHHFVCDSTTVEALLEDLEESLADYLENHGKHYEEFLRNSKLNYDSLMALRHTCENHIDCIIPQNDLQKKSQYTSFLVKECRLQGIPINITDGVEEWRAQLRASVTIECRLALLTRVREWKNKGILKVPLVEYIELLIPCILHLENRVGEKILTMILRKAIELCSTSKKTFIDDLEVVFQQQVLGSPYSPAHWTLPREGRNDAELTTGKITGRNEMIRRIKLRQL